MHILPFEETDERELQTLIIELSWLGFQAAMLPKASIVAPSYNPRRRQYSAEILLDRVRLAPGRCILGVTNRDLYVEGLNFVFGLADTPGKAAVISLHRLHAGADDMLFVREPSRKRRTNSDTHGVFDTARTSGASWRSAIRWPIQTTRGKSSVPVVHRRSADIE
jgi:predicted Zn-dependent protease